MASNYCRQYIMQDILSQNFDVIQSDIALQKTSAFVFRFFHNEAHIKLIIHYNLQ